MPARAFDDQKPSALTVTNNRAASQGHSEMVWCKQRPMFCYWSATTSRCSRVLGRSQIRFILPLLGLSHHENSWPWSATGGRYFEVRCTQ